MDFSGREEKQREVISNARGAGFDAKTIGLLPALRRARLEALDRALVVVLSLCIISNDLRIACIAAMGIVSATLAVSCCWIVVSGFQECCGRIFEGFRKSKSLPQNADLLLVAFLRVPSASTFFG